MLFVGPRETRGFDQEPTDRYGFVEIIPSETTRNLIFEPLAHGNLVESERSLPESLEMGYSVDNYLNFMQTASQEMKNKEVGTYILIGVGKNNLARLYFRRQLRQGMSGRADQVFKPGQEILAANEAIVKGRAHTHPIDPPWHHFGDTKRIARDPLNVDPKLQGGSVAFEYIVSPHQAGFIVATLEAQRFFDSHEVRRDQLRSEINKVVASLSSQYDLNSKLSPYESVPLKSALTNILQTWWYGQIGMAVFASTSLVSPIRFLKVTNDENPERYLKTRLDQGTLGLSLSNTLRKVFD